MSGLTAFDFEKLPHSANVVKPNLFGRRYELSAHLMNHLTEYWTDFRTWFFVANVIHVAMVQDAWDILITKYKL